MAGFLGLYGDEDNLRRRKPAPAPVAGADLGAIDSALGLSPDEGKALLREKLMALERPEPPGKRGKLSTTMGILSDVFLGRDIPQQVRQGRYRGRVQRYEAQAAPIREELGILSDVRAEETAATEAGYKEEKAGYARSAEARAGERHQAPRYVGSPYAGVAKLPGYGQEGEPEVVLDPADRPDTNKNLLDRYYEKYGDDKGLQMYEDAKLKLKATGSEKPPDPKEHRRIITRYQNTVARARDSLNKANRQARMDLENGYLGDEEYQQQLQELKNEYARDVKEAAGARDEELEVVGAGGAEQPGAAGPRVSPVPEISAHGSSTLPGLGGAPAQPTVGKPLDSAGAQRFLQQAGGDKELARQLARKAGYSF